MRRHFPPGEAGLFKKIFEDRRNSIYATRISNRAAEIKALFFF
jgi:hypothetical protein